MGRLAGLPRAGRSRHARSSDADLEPLPGGGRHGTHLPAAVSLWIGRAVVGIGSLVGVANAAWILPILLDQDASPEMRAATAMNIGSTIAVVLICAGAVMIGRQHTVQDQSAVAEDYFRDQAAAAQLAMSAEHSTIVANQRAMQNGVDRVEEAQGMAVKEIMQLAGRQAGVSDDLKVLLVSQAAASKATLDLLHTISTQVHNLGVATQAAIREATQASVAASQVPALAARIEEVRDEALKNVAAGILQVVHSEGKTVPFQHRKP